MAKITNLNDLENITSNITSFSHAYLFNVNSLDAAYSYIKDFAKKILLENAQNEEEKELFTYQIDHDEFDDMYVVNPDTIGISTVEIEKLLTYMETKSLRENGRRIYIIYGFERLSRDVSNKILKFLEEPNDNIYALLMTENMDKILSTIISRCQVINLTFDIDVEIDSKSIDNLKNFLKFLFNNGNKTIAYENNYFKEAFQDRKVFNDYFNNLEKIISNTINKKINVNSNEEYLLDSLLELPLSVIINILEITNKLKLLIKQNINLNLLLDRYIIEVTKELVVCKKL